MKAERGAPRAYRREYSVDHGYDDPYRATVKPPEPTRCPSCNASYQDGRWSWKPAPPDSHEQLCPACQRIEDRFPAGFVTIRGDFLKAHRDELIDAIRAKEKREKPEHPLQRIISIEDVSNGMLQVSTTDSHLARGIGEALKDAFDGDLKIRYSKDENLVRVVWKR